MGSKTISLRTETYRRLHREKQEGESFSDVVDRLLVDDRENPLAELIGLVDGDELESVRRESMTFRSGVDARFTDGDVDSEAEK
ncbi:antitoxin VapB family protein [Natrialbaceae archaeon A-CW3]